MQCTDICAMPSHSTEGLLRRIGRGCLFLDLPFAILLL